MRDEVRMLKQALQGLYDSSIAYGMKKALAAEKDKSYMDNTTKELEKSNKELTKKIRELEFEIEQLKLDYEEERDGAKREHAATKQGYKDQVILLKLELDKILSTKAWSVWSISNTNRPEMYFVFTFYF